MTTLTLTDATPVTPVNRSFPSVQSSPDLTVFKDFTTNGGYPVGAGAASLSVRENPKSATTRIIGKLVLPTLETVSGDTDLGFAPAPLKAFDLIGSFEFVLSGRSSLQNRKDLKAMLIDFLSDAIVTSAVEGYVHPSA